MTGYNCNRRCCLNNAASTDRELCVNNIEKQEDMKCLIMLTELSYVQQATGESQGDRVPYKLLSSEYSWYSKVWRNLMK